MENGEMVAVCLDCFDNLRGQFIEAGKYGIPVEKRQYNWMQIPPPPESESSQLITLQIQATVYLHSIELALFNRNSIFSNLYELNMGVIKNHPSTPLLFHRLGINCIFIFS